MPPSPGASLFVRSARAVARGPRPALGNLAHDISSAQSSPGRATLRRNMASKPDYDSWSRASLIERLKAVEHELRRRPAPPPAPETRPGPPDDTQDTSAAPPPGAAPAKKPRAKRKIDPSRYATRHIALRLAYLGKNYGGFEFQPSGNQPSIEEELWRALTKACLVFPPGGDASAVDFECCEYSKCGRTDRGVSAFGQVVGLRVRSNRPLPKKRARLEGREGAAGEGREDPREEEEEEEEGDGEARTKPFDHIRDELQYPRLLNRLLPPDIRILAWCPSPPPDFSARFSCRERRYRYFFTQPAFGPSPGPSSSGSAKVDGVVKPGWLDIAAMRDAAKRFEGEHDFRNVCKIDASKQITSFVRVVFEADITEVDGAGSLLPYLNDGGCAPAEFADDSSQLPKVYSFNVNGSAFLWHQIRHMVAILFLVGQGLESPSVVTELLDVSRNPSKPVYNMADEVPLVLWDCIFPREDDSERKDALDWIYGGSDAPSSKIGTFGLLDNMWANWREKKMDELLANQLLREISRQGDAARMASQAQGKANDSAIVYEGGNTWRSAGSYVPVMKRGRIEAPEEQNEKYAKRKGYASAEDMREQKGFGRSMAKEAEADE